MNRATAQVFDEPDPAKVLDSGSIAGSFLGNAVEIAIVTRDHRRTMGGLWRLGIGPWQVHTFNPENTTSQTYRGEQQHFTLKVCFAQMGGLIWELIEPVSGPTIFAEFLERHGEGVHHMAYDCNGMPFEERWRSLPAAGSQSCSPGAGWVRTTSLSLKPRARRQPASKLTPSRRTGSIRRPRRSTRSETDEKPVL